MAKQEAENSQESVILRLPLLGQHQVVNAATAYAALKASGLNISDEAIRKGFAGVKWPCRFEIVASRLNRDYLYPIILDSAHNEDSFEKLAADPGRLLSRSTGDPDLWLVRRQGCGRDAGGI